MLSLTGRKTEAQRHLALIFGLAQDVSRNLAPDISFAAFHSVLH